MQTLTLYHTDACHLCEQAAKILTECQVQVNLVDIVDDPQLVERFGTRIPVLENEQGECLDWPFEHDSIQQFLSKTSN